MYGFQPHRHAVLQVLEESADAVYRQSGQVAESHAAHVEKEYVSRRATVRVEARVDGHQQQLDAVVEHVLGRPRIRQSMKNYPITMLIWLGKHHELSTTQVKLNFLS